MIFGYACAFPGGMSLDQQMYELKNAGCEKFFADTIKGKKFSLTERDRLLKAVRKNDIIVVVQASYLCFTARQLIDLLSRFKQEGIHLKSLFESSLDTTSPSGQLLYQIASDLQVLDLDVKRIKTLQGLGEARARGRKGGRKAGSYNKVKAAAAVTLYNRGEKPGNIMEALGIKSKATLYQYLRLEGVQIKGFKKSS